MTRFISKYKWSWFVSYIFKKNAVFIISGWPTNLHRDKCVCVFTYIIFRSSSSSLCTLIGCSIGLNFVSFANRYKCEDLTLSQLRNFRFILHFFRLRVQCKNFNFWKMVELMFCLKTDEPLIKAFWAFLVNYPFYWHQDNIFLLIAVQCPKATVENCRVHVVFCFDIIDENTFLEIIFLRNNFLNFLHKCKFFKAFSFRKICRNLFNILAVWLFAVGFSDRWLLW